MGNRYIPDDDLSDLGQLFATLVAAESQEQAESALKGITEIVRNGAATDAAMNDCPYTIVPVPLNANGEGPETDESKVVRVEWRVWNHANQTVAVLP